MLLCLLVLLQEPLHQLDIFMTTDHLIECLMLIVVAMNQDFQNVSMQYHKLYLVSQMLL